MASRRTSRPRSRSNDRLQRWRRLACAVALLGLIAGIIAPASGEIPLNERRSAYADMNRDNKAMQDDDTSNPAMLWVLDGEALWDTKAGAANKACADCHGDATASMKGVAARYPAFDEALGRPVDIEQRVNLCRTRHQQARPFAHESKELLALTVFVARQSRGGREPPAATNRTGPARRCKPRRPVPRPKPQETLSRLGFVGHRRSGRHHENADDRNRKQESFCTRHRWSSL